ncbi:MAG: fibronectin type III-like domain-contianing protein, partial [Steroidobacteraceae bacterium]
DRVTEDGALEVRVDVENAGPGSVEETVFLFVHDPVASVSRPTLELKDVGRIELGPGERGVVRFHLPAAELKFLGASLEPVFEPGEVEIRVGPSAERARLLAASVRLMSRGAGKQEYIA